MSSRHTHTDRRTDGRTVDGPLHREADLGMFSMFGRTGAPTKRGPTEGQNFVSSFEEARPIPAGSNTSSGSFINHGGLALVARTGVQLSLLRLPLSPSSFECDCVRVSSGAASYVLLTLYRPGSDHVSSVFFDELGRILESIVALSTPIVLAGDVLSLIHI